MAVKRDFCDVKQAKTIQVGGRLMSFSVPKIMGILNLTPDSFYAGSRKASAEDALRHTQRMAEEGADIIDIGAVSTRPGSSEVSADEEKRRLFPVLEALRKRFPDLPLSIDTFRADVAEEAVAYGASLINDISGGTMDGRMPETMARLQVPYVLMHMRGTPQTMTGLTHYTRFPEDVVAELADKLERFRLAGVGDIIIDPGFGFAKTVEQNFRLFEKLAHFHLFDLPLLVGVSRKKMVYGTLGVTAGEAVTGTVALHTAALLQGADLLRVHDVREARQTVLMMEELHFIPPFKS